MTGAGNDQRFEMRLGQMPDLIPFNFSSVQQRTIDHSSVLVRKHGQLLWNVPISERTDEGEHNQRAEYVETTGPIFRKHVYVGHD